MQPHHVLAHQCHVCRRHWALKVIEHPAGTVLLCRFCSAVRSVPGQRRRTVTR